MSTPSGVPVITGPNANENELDEIASGDRDSLARRLVGPTASELPAAPQSWYRFGEAPLRNGSPIAREMLGRRLVAYRDESGKAHVVDGRCPHMGADLGLGEVVGESLRCPFHGWRFDRTGSCVEAPGCAGGVPAARIRTYETAERFGSLFFFLGPRALFPLPFFEGEDPADFLAAQYIVVDYDAPWFLVVGNAFDIQHFHVVHDRKFIGDACIDHPHTFSRRLKYRVEVTGKTLSDRFLRTFVGKEVEVSQQLWGGNVLVTNAVFARAHSRVWFVIEPTCEQTCRMHVQVLARRGQFGIMSSCIDWISMAGRRSLTKAFLDHEVERLGSLRYHSGGLVEADRPFVEFLNWVNTRPTI